MQQDLSFYLVAKVLGFKAKAKNFGLKPKASLTSQSGAVICKLKWSHWHAGLLFSVENLQTTIEETHISHNKS